MREGELAVWDINNLGKPLSTVGLGTTISGSVSTFFFGKYQFPFNLFCSSPSMHYDGDSKMLFLAIKVSQN